MLDHCLLRYSTVHSGAAQDRVLRKSNILGYGSDSADFAKRIVIPLYPTFREQSYQQEYPTYVTPMADRDKRSARASSNILHHVAEVRTSVRDRRPLGPRLREHRETISTA